MPTVGNNHHRVPSFGNDEDDDAAVQHAVGAIKVLMKRTERLHGGSHPIDHVSVDSIARKVLGEQDDEEVQYASPRSPRATAASASLRGSYLRSDSASPSNQRPRSHSKSPHSLRMSNLSLSHKSSANNSSFLPRYLDSTPISTKRSPTKSNRSPNDKTIKDSHGYNAWSKRTGQSHNVLARKKIAEERMTKFNPPPRRIADQQIVNGIVNRLHASNADKIEKREAARLAKEEAEVNACTNKPYVNPRSREIAGQMEHIASRTKKVIKSKQASLQRMKARAERDAKAELRDPVINERSRQLMRQRADLVEWEKDRDRRLEEKRQHAKIDPNCTFKPEICQKSDKVARTIHERGTHPGDRMYREFTHLTLKRERERQRAETEREKEINGCFFKPKISKGSERMARARSRERNVFQRMWSPTRNKIKNKYAMSKSQTPERRISDTSFEEDFRDARSTPGSKPQRIDVVSFDHFRNRRPNEKEQEEQEPPSSSSLLQPRPRSRSKSQNLSFRGESTYAHRHRDFPRRQVVNSTPEHLTRRRKRSIGTDPIPSAEAVQPTVVPLDDRFTDILEKVMNLDSVSTQPTFNSSTAEEEVAPLVSEASHHHHQTADIGIQA